MTLFKSAWKPASSFTGNSSSPSDKRDPQGKASQLGVCLHYRHYSVLAGDPPSMHLTWQCSVQIAVQSLTLQSRTHKRLQVLSIGSRRSRIRFLHTCKLMWRWCWKATWVPKTHTAGKLMEASSALLSVAMYIFKCIFIYLKLIFTSQKLNYAVLLVWPVPYPKQEHWEECR